MLTNNLHFLNTEYLDTISCDKAKTKTETISHITNALIKDVRLPEYDAILFKSAQLGKTNK